MAHHDKSWPQVTQAFTANGSANGEITVTNTGGFYTGALVDVSSSGVNTQTYTIIDVMSLTVIRVALVQNDPGFNLNAPMQPQQGRRMNGSDVSAYTTAQGATVTMRANQAKIADGGSIDYYTYEADPVAARRCFLVDQNGNYVAAGGGSSSSTATVGGAPQLIDFSATLFAGASATATVSYCSSITTRANSGGAKTVNVNGITLAWQNNFTSSATTLNVAVQRSIDGTNWLTVPYLTQISIAAGQINLSDVVQNVQCTATSGSLDLAVQWPYFRVGVSTDVGTASLTMNAYFTQGNN